jgi:hypothetical protein
VIGLLNELTTKAKQHKAPHEEDAGVLRHQTPGVHRPHQDQGKYRDRVSVQRAESSSAW